MIKTIDDITFMGDEVCFMLTNTKNRSYASFNLKSGCIIFRDSFGNIMQNHPTVIKILQEVFDLKTLGQTINRSNGTVIAYLSYDDVQELAHKTFYEEWQTHIFDFMKLEFTIVL
jgi:hypothetical protein